MQSVPHSPGLRNILSFDCRNCFETRICRGEPVGLTRTNGSTFYCAIDNVYQFKTLRTSKHKKKSELLVVFHDEFVHVAQCYSIKCKIANHKYCTVF